MERVTIYINDYPANKKMAISFGPEDFEVLRRDWDKEDERLTALQIAPAFVGYFKWSQLRTEHFRVLLARTMILMEALSQSEREDSEHPVMSTFNFLALGFVRCMEESTGSSIELMKFHRLNAKEVVFDFQASMDMDFPPPPPLSEQEPSDDGPFKIIVDNTKS